VTILQRAVQTRGVAGAKLTSFASEGVNSYIRRCMSRLGGVVVSVLATGPKACGFKTQPRRWIFKGDKKSAAHLPLGWEVMREGPMS
jgi:hypothetical protein